METTRDTDPKRPRNEVFALDRAIAIDDAIQLGEDHPALGVMAARINAAGRDGAGAAFEPRSHSPAGPLTTSVMQGMSQIVVTGLAGSSGPGRTSSLDLCVSPSLPPDFHDSDHDGLS